MPHPNASQTPPSGGRFPLPVLNGAGPGAPDSGVEAREKCGVFGVWGAVHPAHLAYYGLFAQQHRGQESAGIAVTDRAKLTLHTGMGLVSQVFSQGTLKELEARAVSPDARPAGAIGHNRYSTTGASSRENAQPFMASTLRGEVAVAHNGNIVNALDIRRELQEQGHVFRTTSDTEVVLHLLASREVANHGDPLCAALSRLRGAFSLVILHADRVEAARDPWGWRPLVLGRTAEGHWIAASETVALDAVNAQYVREVEPGEVVTISDAGLSTRRFAPPAAEQAHCVFEHVYFASPASRIFGQTVQLVRERLGERLADESHVEADMVTAMPDSGRSAATGYARRVGVPYREVIIPNRYVGRTFIKPTDEDRVSAVRIKLNIIGDIVRDKRIIVIDDSIVRGTTTRAKIDQLRAAGAKEIHLRISCPPIRHPCYFGVDFPDPQRLIASGRTVEDIRALLHVDSLHFLSLEGLLSVVSDAQHPAQAYCTACYSGHYKVSVDPALRKDVLDKQCV